MVQLVANQQTRRLLKAVLLTGTFVGLLVGPAISVWRASGLVFALYVATGGWQFLRVVYYTWWRDLKSLMRLLKTKAYLHILKTRNASVTSVFKENVERHPNRVVFYHQEKKWTFKDLDKFSNRVANCFIEMGFHPGEEVAIFMDSRPEYVGLWLGLAKAGIVSALVNTSQRQDTLVHSLTVIQCKAVIFSSELSNIVTQIMPTLAQKRAFQFFCFGSFDPVSVPARPLAELIEESSSESCSSLHQPNFTDRLFYIYTSGTTGLPKAAIIKHCRYIWIGSALRNLIGFRRDENIYTCIPLYHLAGGVLGTCQCLIYGNSMTIRSKFSASNFWEDCIRYNCTSAQYIGEICRYLLAQPPKPSDTQHKVRMIFGNGLRQEIWASVVKRFNIKNIGEFYGSTEGNANIINNDNREGACGFISRILPNIYPVALIKVDQNTREPVRDEKGLCVRCGSGECGEFIGKIITNDPSRAFDGYVNKDATEKKIVRNVFTKGDSAFLSGDLLAMDDLGYVYFRDRTGDTFRWKGENISTMEVEAVISNTLHLVDCVVFGVSVPGCEGKAGMVAILDPDKCIDLNTFLANLRTVLPTFALPVFVRIVDRFEATGTYKLPKTVLQKESYNVEVVGDPLFYLDSKSWEYQRMDSEAYNGIIKGKIRV